MLRIFLIKYLITNLKPENKIALLLKKIKLYQSDTK